MATFKTMDFTPSADGTFDNMKYAGINVPEIVQELKDNSDDAGAKTIGIYVLPKDKEDTKLEELVILDDAPGMTEDKLWNALILAKRHEHTSADIGKFGVGLKNATMGLGDQICIVSKTVSTGAIGVLMNMKDMRHKNTFEPTQYESDATVLRGHFPSPLWTAFCESPSGTMISVKSIHEHHVQDVKALAQDIHRSLNFNYVRPLAATAAATVIRFDVVPGPADMTVKQVDAFYRKSPENLAYMSETELRVYPNGRSSTVYEVLTGLRHRGRAKGTNSIYGTPQKPALYQMHAFPKKARADAQEIHSNVDSLPSTPYKSIQVRFIEVAKGVYDAEGTTGEWEGFDTRRRGFFFRRGDRFVGTCMTLGEPMDDHDNRFRMEICFPPSLDMEMGVRTQKQMSKNLNSTAISDALRILWRQQANVLKRLHKKEESDASSVSSEEKPTKAATTKATSQNILTHLAEIATRPQTFVPIEDLAQHDEHEEVAEEQHESAQHEEVDEEADEEQEEAVPVGITALVSVPEPKPLEIKVVDKYVHLVQDTNILSRIPAGPAASSLQEWLSTAPLPLGKTKEGLFKHMASFWNIY